MSSFLSLGLILLIIINYVNSITISKCSFLNIGNIPFQSWPIQPGTTIWINLSEESDAAGYQIGDVLSAAQTYELFGMFTEGVEQWTLNNNYTGRWFNTHTFVVTLNGDFIGIEGNQCVYRGVRAIKSKGSGAEIDPQVQQVINLVNDPCQYTSNSEAPEVICQNNGQCKYECKSPGITCPSFYCICDIGYNDTVCSTVITGPDLASFDNVVDGPDIDRYNQVIGVGDAVVLDFDMDTNTGGFEIGKILSSSELQGLIALSPSTFWTNIDIEGKWESKRQLKLTVISPYIGPSFGLSFSPGSTPVRNALGTSVAWSTGSETSSEQWGNPQPSISSFIATNDGQNYGWGINDKMEINFDMPTNLANTGQPGAVLYDSPDLFGMFEFNFKDINDDFLTSNLQGQWVTNQKLSITILDTPSSLNGYYKLENVLTIKLLQTAQIKDGQGASVNAFSEKPINCTGSFGNISATPSILSAKYLTELGEFQIQFNMDTNRGNLESNTSSDNCTRLLTQPSLVYLGENPKCEWRSSSELAIVPDRTSSWPKLNPQMSIAIKEDINLKSWDDTSPIMSQSQLQPTLQLEPDIPNAILSAPAKVGPCDLIRLDGSQSSGFAGSDLIYTWKFVNAKVIGAGNTTLNVGVNTTLTNYMASQNGTRVYVNASILISGFTYDFSLRVTNWLGYSHETKVKVDVSLIAKPNLYIEGGSIQYARVTDFISIPSVFSTSVCSGAVFGKMQLKWSQFNSTMILNDDSLLRYVRPLLDQLGVSKVSDHIIGNVGSLQDQSSALMIPPYSLLVGEVYCFAVDLIIESGSCSFNNFDIGCADEKLRNRVPVLIQLQQQPLRAYIDGGFRDVSFPSSISSPSHTLDASKSYDPDVAGGNAQFGFVRFSDAGSNGLTFKWSCSFADTTTPCFTGNNATFLQQTTISKLVIYKSVVSNYNARYNFSVVVQKGARNATAFTILKFLDFDFPNVFFKPFKTPPNPNSRIVFQLQFGKGFLDKDLTNYEWTTNANLKPEDVLVKTSTSLVLAPNALNYNKAYLFKLSLTRDNKVGGASIGFRTASRACCGTCEVVPKSASFDSKREIICSGWQGLKEDLPLSYSFKVVNSLAGNNRRPEKSDVAQTLSDFSSQHILQLKNGLPPPGNSFSGIVTIECSVRTGSGVIFTFPISATVTSVDTTINNVYGSLTNYLNQTIYTELDNYVNRGDTNAVYQLIFIGNNLLRLYKPEETTFLKNVRKKMINASLNVWTKRRGAVDTNSLITSVTLVSESGENSDSYDASDRLTTLKFIRDQLSLYTLWVPFDEEGGSSSITSEDLSLLIAPIMVLYFVTILSILHFFI